MHGYVFGGVDDELQSHVVEGFGDDHATLEHHDTALSAATRHRRFHLFEGCYVQIGIHRVAAEFHITAILDGKRLEWYDRQGIFHLSVVERIPAAKL